MRVLFIGENEIDRSEEHVCRALHGQCDFFQLAMGPGHPRGERLRQEGVPFAPLRLRSRLDRQGARAIRTLIDTHKIDVVHCVGSHKQIANAARAARGRNVGVIGYRGTIGRLHRLDPTSWLSYLHPRVDRIVCCSNAVRAFMISLKIPPEKLVTIYKGHDPAWYGADPPASRADLGIPPDAVVVSCAARIRPVKGVGVLLQAMTQLRATNVHLLLVGAVDDPEVSAQLASRQDDPRIHALGRREDALALIGASDIFVMPSLAREGFPRAVVEAMAQARACIVSDVGGMPEQIPHAQAGLVVPPGDAAALATAIDTLAGDVALRKRFGQAAQSRMHEQFHIQRTIDATRALYADLAASRDG